MNWITIMVLAAVGLTGYQMAMVVMWGPTASVSDVLLAGIWWCSALFWACKVVHENVKILIREWRIRRNVPALFPRWAVL